MAKNRDGTRCTHVENDLVLVIGLLLNTALDKEAFTINGRLLSLSKTSDARKLEKPRLPPKPALPLAEAPGSTNSNSPSEPSTNRSSPSTPVTPPLFSPSSEPIICLSASLSCQTIAPPTDVALTEEACCPSPASPVQPMVFSPRAPPSPHRAPPTLFPSPPSTPPRSDPPSPTRPAAPRGLQELSEAV